MKPMTTKQERDARLSALIGEGDFDEQFLSLVAEGESPPRLATKVFNVAWHMVRKWIESDPERLAAYQSALRAGADKLMYDGLVEVKDAEVETVQLAKLRSDFYVRMAGKMDRKQWGEKVEVAVEHSINIADILAEARGRVDAALENRQPERVPVKINEFSEVV